MSQKLTKQYLKKKNVPNVLIAGLLMASVLGWTGWNNLDKIQNFYQIKTIFPDKTKAIKIVDGDTFVIKNGLEVRLIGINAPDLGQTNYSQSTQYLTHLILNKPLSFEYDQDQNDLYGRILAYVWINCNDEIRIYCHEDKALVNEIMIKQGLAVRLIYSHHKKLKYDSYLQ